ncbi:GcrA cell cycle regulator [Sinorhizobium sojae CCBAU 05684]|uniref:GcrA cell cycle regulator n=1 Tax=Sinorhizobium sojae CCBAU 05684 TaxID=716928 RepID=A0A249PGQ3_9HYPH|nr:GcrA family cell cycle regulator [Sinorhizobium sojae]ASY64459.1 GcrA cell cycle regulator [Sinorhizobium sojae CCBAU 05684]
MSEWTEERIEQLKKLHAAGHSASQIAAMMGGVSRNGVIGKIHRLRLPTMAKPRASAKPRAIKMPVRKAAAVPVKAKATPVVPPRDLPRDIESVARPSPVLKRIMDADWDGRHECRWPVEGEKEQTRFCCHPVSGESSYCEYHRRAARGEGTKSERKVAPMPIKRVA